MRRRYAYRSSSNSENTSVNLSERSKLSESVDAETPFQLYQVMEEQGIVQFHVHVTRLVSLCTTFISLHSLGYVNMVYNTSGVGNVKRNAFSLKWKNNALVL